MALDAFIKPSFLARGDVFMWVMRRLTLLMPVIMAKRILKVKGAKESL
jgi:hypothetical protein